MTSSAIVSRYAGALADVATGRAAGVAPPQILEQLQAFDSLMASSTDLRNALVSPGIPASRKKAVVGHLADRLGLGRIVRNFLFVLIDHRRIAALPELVQSFEVELDSRLGFARAEVVAASDLSPRQQDTLRTELEGLAGKKIKLKYSVDPGLIGGVTARIGSTVYNGSVRARLEALGKRMAAE